jgi:polyhydroxybutyrate depolymerase
MDEFMRRLAFVLCLVWLGALVVSAQEATPPVTGLIFPEATITPTPTFDSLHRTYALHVPDEIDAPAPLVIVLHGRFGDGAGMEEYSQFDRVADAEGFIVAYPDGVGGEWNFTQGISGYADAQDDIAFLNTLIDEIAAEHEIDLTRVYLAGFSNGGFMAQRVACENPARFAGFASVSASGFGGMPEVCRGTLPAPMLLIHGTADNNVPWDGTSVTRGGQTIYITYPIAHTFGYWAAVNGCQPDAEQEDLPQRGDSPETIVRVLRLDCPAESPVVLYGILGGGHNWARPDLEPYPSAGPINRDIDTGEEIWRFFAPLHRAPG